MAQLFGQGVADALQAANTQDASAIISAFGTVVNHLNDADGPLFRNLGEGGATPEIGAQRRTDQQRLIHLKAGLLGVAQQLLATHRPENFGTAVTAFRAARIDMTSAEPAWFTASLAQAADSLNIEDPDARAAIAPVADDPYFLGLTTNDTARVTAAQPASLSNREKVYRKALEAKAINDRILQEEEAARARAKYEADQRSGFERVMDTAASDGREMFEKHHRENYSVRFASYGEGSSIINLLSESHPQLFREFTNTRGAAGYINALDNMLAPAMLDQMADLASSAQRGLYTDFGGRYKSDYESRGQQEAWRLQVRNMLQTQIYGNALGFLEGVVAYGGTMDEATRGQLFQSALEVLAQAGNGHLTGQDGLLMKPADYPDFAQRIRTRLLEFMKRPVAAGEKIPAANEAAIIEERKARLMALKSRWITADAGAVTKIRTREEVGRKRVLEIAQQKEALAKSLRGAGEQVQRVDQIVEQLGQMTGRADIIGQFTSSGNLDRYITVARDTGANTLNITLNQDTLSGVRKDRDRIREQLETGQAQDPGALRLRLATLDDELALFTALHDRIDGINRSERTVFQEGTFRRKTVVQIKDGVLRQAGQARNRENDIQWNFSEQVTRAVREITNQKPADRTGTGSMGMDEMRAEIEQLLQAGDLSPEPVQRRIQQAVSQITERERTAQLHLERLNQTLANAITQQAIVLAAETLKDSLTRQNLIDWHS